MSEPWRDINDPGAFFKPEKEEEAKPQAAPEPVQQREPLAKEYRFKDVSIIEPAQGFEKNKPFDISGEIEPYGEKVSASKILLYSMGVFNGAEDNFFPGGIEANLDTSTWKFKATCKYFLDPDAYINDENKPAGTTWKLYIRAKGAAAEKPMESEQMTFPKPSKFVVLKKGNYDEDGASAYNKPQSGDNFKPDGVVKSLQGDFIKTSFLPQGSDDGYFGNNTDAAVKEFQDYAIKQDRMKRKVGKVEKTDKTLDQQQSDGIVGKKTRDELDRWLQNDWIKPIPTLRYGEYDDTGVNNGKGKRGADNHHINTPVEDNQKKLQSAGVYVGCALDGWFFDKMKDAVKLFQDAAEKGMFIINGILTDVDVKLTGHHKGELCPKTQEYLKIVVDKGGIIPRDDKEFQLFVCTVYGEAAGCTEFAWRAIGHVIMNRLHDSGEKYLAPSAYRESVTSIITQSGFDAYAQMNEPFLSADTYFKNGKNPKNDKLDKMIVVLEPIYQKSEADTTNGAVLYYSPKAQAEFHKENPERYSEKPRWKFEELQEVPIAGLDQEKDDFKFYKYK
jgi:peptidoglycan hydrolase-like protein with peptidoglycan-binding domain